MNRALIFKRVISAIMVIFLMVGAVPVSAAEQPEEVTLYEADDYVEEPDVQQETDAEAAALSAASNAATSGVCGDNLTWVFDEATGTLTISGTGEMDFVDQPWESFGSQIKCITIYNGVSTIENEAFYFCRNVESVTIPSSVVKIGVKAFSGCSSLTSIVVPSNVSTIGSKAFDKCGFKSAGPIGGNYDYEYGWTDSIPAYAFYGCNSLTSLVIPESITTVGYLFAGECTGLKTAGPIGSGCDYQFGWKNAIPDGAFRNCSGLVSVELPDGLISIGNLAFQNCSKLASVNIPGSVTSLKSATFQGCESLKTAGPSGGDYNIILGSSSTIPDYAFADHENLTSIIIPDGVTSIGTSAFRSCSSLSYVYIPDSVVEMGPGVFSGCTQLLSAGPVGSGNNIEFGWQDSIPAYAFYDCDALMTVKLPEDITTIGKYAFSFSSSISEVIIPDSVKSIADYAFYKCDGLANISLSKNLELMGEYAFGHCSSLVTINIPSKLKRIEEGSFTGCSSLRSVVLSEGLTYISTWAFENCSSLIYVKIPSTLTAINTMAFDGCTSMTTAGPLGGGYNYEFLWKEEIPDSIFGWNENLTKVVIPTGIMCIGSEAFYSCTNLVSVELRPGIKEIERSAFSNCSSLQGIVFPESIETLGSSAFDESTDIKFSGNAPSCDEAYYATHTFSNSATIYYVEGTSGWTDSGDYDPDNNTWKGYKLATWNPDDEPDAGGESNTIEVPKGEYLIHVVDSNGRPLPGATVVYDSITKYTDIHGDALFDQFTIGTPAITVSLAGYETWTNANSNWEKSESRYETIVLYSEDEGAYKLSEALYSSSEDMSHPYNLLVNTKTVSKLNTGNLVGDFGMGSFFISCRATDISNVSAYQLWQGEKKVAESVNGFFELHVDNFEKGGDCFVRVVANDGTSVDTSINLQIDTNEVNKDNSIKISEGKVTIKVGDDVPFIGGQNVEVKLPDELPIDFEFTDTKVHIGFNIKRFDSDNNKEDKWQNMKETLESLSNLGKLELDKTTEKELDELIKENKSMQLPGTGSVKVYLLGYAEADWGSSVAQGSLYLVVKASTKTIDFNTVVVSVPVTVQIKVTADMKFGGDVSYNWSENTFNTGIAFDLTVGLNAFGGVGVGKLVGVGAYGDAKLLVESELKGTDPGLKKIDITGELGLKAYIAWFTYERAFAHRTWHIYTANNTRAGISLLNASNSFSAGNYNVEALDYLANESAWIGYPISTFAIGASTAFKTLLAGTYRNSQPTMVSNGNALYAAFLRADTTTNKVYAALSYFNGSGWSEPVHVDEKAILDDAPQLLSDSSGNLWMAYASTTSAADTNSIASYATNQNIVVGSVDTSANFTEQKRYTPSLGAYAHMQTLAVVNGEPTLFWVESVIIDEDDIFSSNSNTIKYGVYSGGTWSEAQTLTTINYPIRQLAAGDSGVACNIDTDNDLNTTNDLRLTTYSMSGVGSVIANGVTGNVTYGTLPGTNTTNFIWNGDGVLYCGDTSITMPGITNEYAVVGDSVYFSVAEDGGTVLTLMKYDGSGWSEPIRLISSSAESRYFENLSAAELNGKDYVFGLNTAVDISEDSVTPDKNLVWASVDPVSDLRIDSVDYDAAAAIPGEQIQVALTVVNGGDHAVSNVQVTVNGAAQTIGSINLAPGESAEIPISITCPNTETAFNICVTAQNEILADDFNPDDNSYELTLGLANLVTYLSYERIGTSRTLVASVTNEGISPASGTVVFYDAEGSSYGKTDFKELESGGVVVVRLPLPDSFAGKYDGGNVSVEVSSEQNELFEFDNSATAYLYESTGISIDTVVSTSAGIEAQVTYYGQPNGANVFCAFYDLQGRMVSSQMLALNIGTQTVTFSDVANATEAKVFVLSTSNCPLCKSKGISF